MSEFEPTPYLFTLTDVFDKPLILDENVRANIVAHCPPFHILLDHTIAALWILFSKSDEVALRSGQISWALKFLEGMTNENNTYAVDIQKAIDCLQNALVNAIANEDVIAEEIGQKVNVNIDENEEEETGEEFNVEFEYTDPPPNRPVSNRNYLADREEIEIKSILLKYMMSQL